MLPSPPLTASSFYKYFHFFIPTNIINAAATNGNCKRQALRITQSRFASPSASSAHDFISLPPFYFHYAQSANSHHCLGTITMHLTQAAPTTSSHSQCTCTAQSALTTRMHRTTSTPNAHALHNQHLTMHVRFTAKITMPHLLHATTTVPTDHFISPHERQAPPHCTAANYEHATQ
jgi:hypothetical protein